MNQVPDEVGEAASGGDVGRVPFGAVLDRGVDSMEVEAVELEASGRSTGIGKLRRKQGRLFRD